MFHYPTSRLNRTFVDVPASVITALAPDRWRLEVFDSEDTSTQRNRVNTAYVILGTIPAFDSARPVINSFRIRNILNAAGAAYSQVMVDATGPLSTLSGILVQGPNSYVRHLLTTGRYSPQYGGYLLEEPETLTPGLYTITVFNAAGSAVRSMYVPAANALPQPDYHYFYNDREPNGDMRISWAPVAANVPVWYTFRLFAQDDLDGDGLVNLVYTQSVNNSITFQTTSVTVPAAVVAQWPMAGMAQISVADGLNYSVINNSSLSRMVGAENPGLNNYATLVDGDGDGYTGDIDPNDANASLYPFSAGNDALATAVTGTSPLNGAAGVPPSATLINVAFNKVIDQSSLTTTSFTLTSGAGGVTGTVTYSPATRTAIFYPSGSLLPGTTYTATLTTSLRDQAGNALGAPYVWSFTTAGIINANHWADGTYSYDPATGALATTTTASDFACDGPGIGLKTETVLSLTSTTMTWQGMPQPWTRLNGIAGDITGTWRMTDTVTGTAYTFFINANGTFSVSAGMFMCGPDGPLLSVTIVGGGNVNSDTGAPGIHGTVAGTFSSPYLWVAPVVLTETPHAGWDFSGWSGDCTPSGINCSLIMDAPAKNVTANFTVQPNIKVGTSSNIYGTIQEALNLAADGSELRLQKLPMVFTENPVYNRPAVGITPAANITMNGGWDSGFTSNVSGMTVIKGILRVQAGRLNVQKIIVQK